MITKSNPLYLTAKRTLAQLVSNAVSRRQFIFCASTGRSGTHTLRRVYEGLPGVWTEHEPWPRFNGELLAKWNSCDPDDERQFRVQVRNYKFPRIVYRAGLSQIYLEANHQFIKSFADEFAESLGDNMKVIILRRTPTAVAASMTGRGDVPGTERGNVWNLNPKWPRNVIDANDLLDHEPYCHAFYQCIWYCFEVESRIQRFQQKYPEIPSFEMVTSDLNNKERILELGNWMGLSDKATAQLDSTFSPRKEDASRQPPSIPKTIDSDELRHFINVLNGRLNRPMPPEMCPELTA